MQNIGRLVRIRRNGGDQRKLARGASMALCMVMGAAMASSALAQEPGRFEALEKAAQDKRASGREAPVEKKADPEAVDTAPSGRASDALKIRVPARGSIAVESDADQVLERRAAGTARAAVFTGSVRNALMSHPRYGAFLAGIESREAQIREARAGYFPTISVGVTSRVSRFSAADQDLDGNVRDRGVEYDSDALLTVQQNLFDGGATVNQVKVAKAATRVEAASSTEGLADLAIRAIESWHDVLRERMRHELALRQLAAHKTILARVTLRYERGAAPVTDLARAEARLADARATVITREAGLEIAIQNYVEAYGETPGEVGFVRFTELVPGSVTDALSQARAMNASLIRAAAERDQAEANVRVAQSAYYPQLQLEGNAVQFDIWDNREYGLTGRLIASYPIFEGGARSARNERAKANLARAQFQQSAVSRAIDRDVRVTWERVQALGRRLVTQEKALRANEEARALIREQFGFGGRSLFDLLEAERDVFTAADQYLSSRIDFEISRFELAAVTGVLLNLLDVSIMGQTRDERSEDAPQPGAPDDF